MGLLTGPALLDLRQLAHQERANVGEHHVGVQERLAVDIADPPITIDQVDAQEVRHRAEGPTIALSFQYSETVRVRAG